MSSKLKKAIGAVKDQTSISLAKVSSSSGANALEVAVLKATSHDPSVPLDGKHAREILRLVAHSKSHAAACAHALGKRIGRTHNWAVALKSLLLVLRLFQGGDPYFPREVIHAMRRGDRILNLSSFRDSSSSSPWDFTSFVRTLALYLDERLDCFLTGKLHCRHGERAVSAGKSDHVRDMKPGTLLDRMSHWQRLLDRAIAMRPTGATRDDPLVRAALHAVVRESFDLYRDVSDGLALVLDSFFHLQYQNCVAAFQTCMKAVKQFEELTGFYRLCRSLGVGRSSEYPSVQVISEELIETLREFLKDQSSFSPRPVGPLPAVRVRPRRVVSPTPAQCASLEELISATETAGGEVPAISIDLEAYPLGGGADEDDTFKTKQPGSSRSLPITTSIVDLMSLDNWTDQDNEQDDKDATTDEELQQDRKEEEDEQKGCSDSPASRNWEMVLAETISTPPASNSEQPSPERAAGNGGEIVVFEAPPAKHEPMTHNHYNPFLVDLLELAQVPSPSLSSEQELSVPTFQAGPTFTAQPTSEEDPFGEFTGEMMMSGGQMDQQNLVKEQQRWLHNQNKIIAKNWT